MTLTREEHAARNNAQWCNTVCAAHGSPGEFHPAAWINRDVIPRFHSHAVVTARRSADAVLRLVDELLSAHPPRFGGLKDSFCEIDLSSRGFSALFEANWIWRDPSAPLPSVDASDDVAWHTIETDSALAEWERAWASGDPPGDRHPRQFPPSLLSCSDHRFIGGYCAGKVVAGAIANRTGEVVGISNVFQTINPATCWRGAMRFIENEFPGLPIVGYERGNDLLIAQAAGFEVQGMLRVWSR
ncbi:MAG TPA: hypothetical protein PLD59_09135 [Tepidisphaeraceae bacterium]|nr:hypothetical protein [Tepidisphaeraceae bacterium]